MYDICIPIHEDGEKLTFVATTAVSGKTFAAVTGGRQGDGSLAVSDDTTGKNYQGGTCGLGGNAVGVWEYDGAIGDKVGVIAASGHIVPIVAGAAINAGQLVQSDAAGKAIPWDGTTLDKVKGTAMNGAASGAEVEVKLRNL